jgi:hypothetical protein
LAQLLRAIGVEVEVEAVLDHLALRYPLQEDRHRARRALEAQIGIGIAGAVPS